MSELQKIDVVKTFKRFLTFPNCKIKCIGITGKSVTHGAGYGLEIPVNFKLLEPTKAFQWAENAVKKFLQNIDQRIKHCKK